MFYECGISKQQWVTLYGSSIFNIQQSYKVSLEEEIPDAFVWLHREKIIRFCRAGHPGVLFRPLDTVCVWLDFQVGQAREFCLEIPAPGSGLASLTGSVHRGSGAVPVECHLHQGLSFWKRGDQTGNWWMQMFLLSPSFSTCPPEKSYLVICKNNKFPLPTARCCFLWGEKCVSNWLFLFFFSFFLFF